LDEISVFILKGTTLLCTAATTSSTFVFWNDVICYILLKIGAYFAKFSVYPVEELNTSAN